jgi:benzylsuccinate CoA-transferase BbsF subunit
LTHHDEIDGHIGQWTKDKVAQDVMKLLQSHGVPAGVVQRSSDLLQDPQLTHRNLYRYMDHPDMGNIPYTGHQFRIQGYDSGPRSPAPLLGQHNEYVLKDLLGMTDEDMIEAMIAGAIA